MSRIFEELDRQNTPIGQISLRRRLEPTLLVDLFEIKIGEDGLMSSLITDGEEAVSSLGLAAMTGEGFDVIVGGLGLGYTAAVALADERVRSLQVIEALAPVIDWHERHLVPMGPTLTEDPRCEFVHGDFFDIAAAGFAVDGGGSRSFDAIFLDIDHSPRHLLDPKNASFYEQAGTDIVARSLRSGGVFSLWSNDAPDDEYLAVLDAAFDTARAKVVTFANPLTGTDTQSTIYISTVA